jgi:RimJ/RimL family protein N-acetyltransferase
VAFDPAASYPLVLRHGVPALLRPLRSADRETIREAFRRLSPESAYLRFWTRVRELNPRFIDKLLVPEEGMQATWVIVLPESADIPGVGGGSFWRFCAEPDTAEVSFTVADEFQNQGVGTILLATLWEHAATLGIRRFEANVLDANLVMRAWWDALGASATQVERGWRLLLPLKEDLLESSSAAASLRDWLRRLRS